LAFSKDHKSEIVAQYVDWFSKSQAVYTLSYAKMSMKDIDTLRVKVRDAGGEIHVIKNTLMKLALDELGVSNQDTFEGLTIAGFAFSDAPALAKVFSEATAKSEIFAIKGGYLGKAAINAKQVKALADLPALPVMRAMLLGTINAPASKLVRTIAEPARGLAAVLKAYSEKDAAPTAA
jgi:large subunit ribosomal protein L10